jgi:hypothetical protein
MGKVVTASRNSRTADRQGPAAASPFRSSRPLKRMLGAQAMMEKRRAEIADLEALLKETADPAEQQRVTHRLTASYRNLASWETYLHDGSPKETRAVIVP